MKLRVLPWAVCLVLLPQAAFAHLVSTRFGEFYSGALHPLSTLSHVLPWMAIALLCGLQQSGVYARQALILFPLATFSGAIVGSQFSQPDWVQLLNLASFLIGFLVALALHLRPPIFIAVLSLFGFSHGFANGEPGLQGSDFVLYVAGVGVAAYLLMTLVTAATKLTVQHTPWGSVAIRAGGSWITAVGILYIGFNLMIPPGLE